MIRAGLLPLLAQCKSVLLLLLRKRYKLLLVVASLYATAVAAHEVLFERLIPDLGRADQSAREKLLEHWRHGDLVVLVRHVERCDHADAPCLNSADGITERAAPVAAQLGSNFRSLGLQATDIYTSPLTRAVQTSTYMFDSPVPAGEWLVNCKDDFREQIAQHKKPHRNLVLVTHSECVNYLQASLGLPSYRTPSYGASLFLHLADSQGEPSVIGSLNASSWEDISPPSSVSR
ncbi:histidine phosphatase family protein [Pseudomonas sp. LFM046]|uniref:lipopolysaccharide core heptose(II)-phosphate phosphatase PmrG n=1 Tax=Pseudomonas sp. LFM046 TaxID=1608357 RepID=UPI0005CFE3E8|nr:histidine phosphatase family protein [Pseudomonas sp. LFM046]